MWIAISNKDHPPRLDYPALRFSDASLAAGVETWRIEGTPVRVTSVTIDWQLRESARSRIRVLVKRILNKYGYPPDLQDEAVQTVLQQAELLCADWTAEY